MSDDSDDEAGFSGDKDTILLQGFMKKRAQGGLERDLFLIWFYVPVVDHFDEDCMIATSYLQLFLHIIVFVNLFYR